MSDPLRELDCEVVRELRNRGVEMTPDEVAEIRTDILGKIRAAMRRRGIDVPDDDVELLQLLKEAGL